MSLKTGLFFTLLLFTLRATRTKDPSKGNLFGVRNVKHQQFLESTHPARQLPASQGSTKHQVKRSTLFNTGVKICPEENMAEVIASHIAYYKLRVCQEAVWEAFQIFLDRVPDAVEYHEWMNTCQRDSLCIDDLARNFSSNQEHIDMVTKSLLTTTKIQNEPKSALATSAPGKKCLKHSAELNAMKTEKSSAPSMKHVIEFSVKVKDTGYSELLKDPGSLQYQDATRQLQEQMLQNFNKLPGFKEIRLLEIQPGGVGLHCAVIFETEPDLTEAGSSETSGETATEIVLKDMILTILRKDISLALDIVFLSTDPNRTTDITRYKHGDISTEATVNIYTEGSRAIGASEENDEVMENTTQKISPPVTAVVTDSSPPTGTNWRNLRREISLRPQEPRQRPIMKTGSDTVVSLNIPSEASEISSDTASAEGPSGSDPIKLMFSSLSSTVETIQPVQSGTTPDSALPETIQRASPITSGNIFYKGKHQTKECERNDYGNKLPFETEKDPQLSVPTLNTITPIIMAPNHTNGLVVFFSLQVTNLMISEDFFNESSLEYKSLENTFLELKQFSETSNQGTSSEQTQRGQQILASILFLMHLQSNMTGLNELYIFSFRNGSVVVNSRTKLVKPVLQNVTKNVQCILEDFCNNASNRLDVEINAQSVDVAAAEHNDPCWYMDCNEFSHCVVNTLTTEAECVCDPGYRVVDGLRCQSICNLEPNYCLNGGLCENIPELGVTCRCPVGKYWYYQGARCNELLSLPADPFLFVACLVPTISMPITAQTSVRLPSLTLVCAVIGMLIFINKKCIRTRKTVTLSNSHSSLPLGGIMRVNPVYENDENILTCVSSISYSRTTDSGSSKSSDLGTFQSVKNIQLDPKECRLSNEHRMLCCLPRQSDSGGLQVTVL
ncbi:interphotoreceptor matrix proteoglycan 1 [Trichomycterus rosablanca]|uniref:interphotoreceptor matrix proteoglycan 1 n=1 Tax=Trichomycterus rosablanca TaxID=2290929 RepID=UPI002F3600F5